MYKSDMETIDFLKIDIEGAEVALFDASRGRPDLWLPKVQCFSIEVSFWTRHSRDLLRLCLSRILSFLTNLICK